MAMDAEKSEEIMQCSAKCRVWFLMCSVNYNLVIKKKHVRLFAIGVG
jgi:hypothetical protein